jgi:glycosyltransferase involved in cell wall biosynthesis
MKLKIAHVTATFPPYWAGTGNVAYHNARLLHERGHDVTVFTAKTARSHELTHPFKVEYLPAVFRIGNAPLTPGLVLGLRGFDLIHLHYPYIFGAELTVAAAKLYKIPLCITYHNDLQAKGLRGTLFQLYSQLNQRLILGAGTRLVVTSEDYAANSKFAKTAPKTTSYVVPNGVDTEQFQPNQAASNTVFTNLGIAPETPLVLFVGGLDSAHYFKGVSVLIDALSYLENAHAVIVGEGDLRSSYELQAQAAAKGRVHFAGKVPLSDLIALYQTATVTVLPSTTQGEAFGMVLIESMACGTPVVASDLPGVRTVVNNGVDGLLVAAGDAKRLAGALAHFTDDTAATRVMGERGRAKVNRTYAWPHIGDRLEQLYQQVLT